MRFALAAVLIAAAAPLAAQKPAAALADTIRHAAIADTAERIAGYRTTGDTAWAPRSSFFIWLVTTLFCVVTAALVLYGSGAITVRSERWRRYSDHKRTGRVLMVIDFTIGRRRVPSLRAPPWRFARESFDLYARSRKMTSMPSYAFATSGLAL